MRDHQREIRTERGGMESRALQGHRRDSQMGVGEELEHKHSRA